MTLSVLPDEVKPIYLESLGEWGLTATQIATALGTTLHSVHRKLKRNDWHSGLIQNWRVKPYGFVNHINKLQVTSFMLNLRAAHAFCLRWNNLKADLYANALYDLMMQKNRRPIAKSSGRVYVPIRAINLLFDDGGLSYEYRNFADTTALERDLGKLHRARCLEKGWRTKAENLQVKINQDMMCNNLMVVDIETLQLRERGLT